MFYYAFAKDPMDKSQGHRFRHTVLEKGASQDEMLILKQFLGRKPTTNAFCMELGLVESMEEPLLKGSSFAGRDPAIEEGTSSEEDSAIKDRPS